MKVKSRHKSILDLKFLCQLRVSTLCQFTFSFIFHINTVFDTPILSLTAHCMVNFNDRVFVIGGWNTRDTVFELRECGLIPLRFRLPRDYRVHRYYN